MAHRRLSEPMSSVGQRKPGRDQRRRDKAGRERRSDQERQVGGGISHQGLLQTLLYVFEPFLQHQAAHTACIMPHVAVQLWSESSRQVVLPVCLPRGKAVMTVTILCVQLLL